MTIFGIYYPEPEGCRTNRITLRLTDKEQEMLKDAAWKSKMSQAAFIRSKVFGSKVPELPAEVKDSLHRLDYSITKIGTNINQIAHVANGQGFILQSNLVTVKRQMDAVFEITKKIVKATYDEKEANIKTLERKIDKLMERVDAYGDG